MDNHVRFAVGQTVHYAKMPQFTCAVSYVHDETVPVVYDLIARAPHVNDLIYRWERIPAADLSAVDELWL
jgi:hypothetical protein